MANWSVIQRTPTASAVETRAFLSSHSITDDELMRELWNVSSGLPGLLDARGPGSSPRQLRRGEKDFTYNLSTDKYRRVATGKAVSEREIRNAIAKTANEAKGRIRKETQQMVAGTIMFVIWYARMRSVLKALYRSIWIVTLGGMLFENDSARNAFYLWVILMFDRLDQLKIAVETGTIPFNGRIVTAAGNMARAGNGLYQNAKIERGKRYGHNQARRVLGPNENHCHDTTEKPGCIELSELGWVSIHTIVPIGGATCRDNCMCQMETRMSNVA